MSKAVETRKLVCADAKNNNNKFWQGILHDDGRVLCSWGRVGASGEQEWFDGGKSYLDKKVREKVKKGYREVEAVDSVQVSHISNTSTKQIKDIAKNQIVHKDSEVAKLIERLVEENRHQISDISGGQVIINKSGSVTTILGDILTQNAINEARKHLNSLSSFVNKTDFDNDKYIESLNEYLKIIPQKVGHSRGWHKVIFKDKNDIHKQSDFLDQLEASIDLVTLNSKNDGVASPKVFDTEIHYLNDKKEYSRITDLFYKTLQKNHSCSGLKPINVFKVEVKHVKDGFNSYGSKMNNIYELWHGSNIANILSILQKGYVMPGSLKTAGITGALFGGGIYFANSSTKSLNYSYGYWSGGRYRNCFMFLNDVAMGNYYIPSGGRNSPPPSGYDSYWAKAGKSGVIHDECIVFNTKQINIKYLIEFN